MLSHPMTNSHMFPLVVLQFASLQYKIPYIPLRFLGIPSKLLILPKKKQKTTNDGISKYEFSLTKQNIEEKCRRSCGGNCVWGDDLGVGGIRHHFCQILFFCYWCVLFLLKEKSVFCNVIICVFCLFYLFLGNIKHVGGIRRKHWVI